MPDLSALLAERLAAQPAVRRWVIAYSGGLDSTVLLHLCAQILPPERLRALHIDHQLQPESSTWARHCAAVCAGLAVEYRCEHVTPASASEADARAARYAVFERELQPDECLLLAQHGDDQVETLLLRLLRGAGVRGLAAMPVQRPLGQGLLLRPLLDQPRARLLGWAETRGLQWIDDPSNARDLYDRNWLRHHLLAPLQQRWPSLVSRVATTTAHLREACELLDERAAEDLADISVAGDGVAIDAMIRLSTARQRNLLRYWVQQQSGRLLTGIELQQIQRMLAARKDAQPELVLGEYQLRRYRGRLYLLGSVPAVPPATEIKVQAGTQRLAHGVLTFVAAPRGLPPGRRLQVRYRQGGESLRPQGRGGSVSLKQLLQEAGVPPWWRAGWPLLQADGEILVVPGICLCEGASATPGLIAQWSPFGLSDAGVPDKL